MKEFSFRPKERLRKRADFLRLLREGERLTAGPLQLYFAPSPAGVSRLGIIVSRKHGKACRRNRLRRVIREAFRLTKPHFPEKIDLVVRLKPKETVDFWLAKKVLEELCDKLAGKQRK